MSFKWSVAGTETKLRFIESATHAFLMVPAERFGIVGQGREAIFEFVKEKIKEMGSLPFPKPSSVSVDKILLGL